jgi:hypothetical protein
LREALVNAAAHRDYSLAGSSIRVEKFTDRIAILSPGLPPPPLTLEKLRTLRYLPCSRNPNLARGLSFFERMEEQGDGLRRSPPTWDCKPQSSSKQTVISPSSAVHDLAWKECWREMRYTDKASYVKRACRRCIRSKASVEAQGDLGALQRNHFPRQSQAAVLALADCMRELGRSTERLLEKARPEKNRIPTTLQGGKMTINRQRRQRQLARKAAKAKAKAKAMRASGAPRAVAAPRFPLSARTWPVNDALISEAIQNINQGTVILSRRSGNSIAVAVFLVDTGCMGIKSAFGGVMTAAAYGSFLAKFRTRENLVQARPECLRKLVEGALSFAADLGFSADPDYHRVKELFGDIDSSVCTQEFEFGKDGKPFYVSGANDSPARIQAVMEQLSRRCGGPEGFHFMIASPANHEDFMDPE